MADQVEFELVSPERLLLSRPVDMVVVPGGDGDTPFEGAALQIEPF